MSMTSAVETRSQAVSPESITCVAGGMRLPFVEFVVGVSLWTDGGAWPARRRNCRRYLLVHCAQLERAAGPIAARWMLREPPLGPG